MFLWPVWIPVIVICGLAAMQLTYVLSYLRFLRQASISPPTLQQPPAVAVVLCLRGADPTLEQCLIGLWSLDYPDYQLHLVFDDHDDPARRLARRFVDQREGGPPVKFHTIQDLDSGRSLKCSAIITAVLELDSEVQVIALVDADAAVEPDWLKRLVAPLQDPQVGAATGNRWFAPEGGLGSMVRKVWNAAALPQMTMYGIAWGGSLAIKRETIEQCQLLDHWSTAFCEDTMLSGQLAKQGLSVERVPELIVVNRESTTLRDALQWIGRQLLTVRLYHGSWPWVFGHALLGAVCLLVPPLVILYFLIQLQWLAALWLAVAWLAFQVVNFLLIQAIELGNLMAISKRRLPSESSEQDHSNDRRSRSLGDVDSGLPCLSATGAIAIGLLQLIYPFLAIAAAFRQRVRWRGIDYRIEGRRTIEMVEYRRFAELEDPDSIFEERSIH